MPRVSKCSTGISNQPICCCSKTGCGWPTLAWRNCSPVRRTGAGPMREPERPNTWLLSKYAHGMLVFGVEYPFDSLTGAGSIQGYPVKCISAEWLVKFHSGYELEEHDYCDVSALCERFGIALPAEYERFQ